MSDQPTVTTEGRTLGEALRAAADALGVDVSRVEHKLDLAHFRNAFGAATGQDTVKIVAWAGQAVDNSGGEAARAWLSELVTHMGLEAKVATRLRSERNADLRIDSESARFLVGKQGRTLNAIRHLLAESVGRAHPGWSFHLDVVGGQDRDERPPRRDDERGGRDDERPPRRDDERGGRDRDDRGRGRDRDDRGRGRGRDDRGGRDRDDRGRGRDRSEGDVEALKRLGHKVAENVLRTGEPETIRRRLNSYERRIVHLAVKDIPGVGSHSIEQDDDKLIEIFPRTEGAGEE